MWATIANISLTVLSISIIVWLWSTKGAVIAFLKGYGEEKGKNRAIQEELENVVKQMSAITKATEDIKAQISDDVWIRQRRWEMKRDVLFETANKLSAVLKAFIHLRSVSIIAGEASPSETIESKRQDALEAWENAASSLDGSMVHLSIACSAQVDLAIREFFLEMRGFTVEWRECRTADRSSIVPMIVSKHNAIVNAIRRELGIEVWVTLQSTESSAAPSPGSPTPG